MSLGGVIGVRNSGRGSCLFCRFRVRCCSLFPIGKGFRSCLRRGCPISFGLVGIEGDWERGRGKEIFYG
jgi:hypothetical protein